MKRTLLLIIVMIFLSISTASAENWIIWRGDQYTLYGGLGWVFISAFPSAGQCQVELDSWAKDPKYTRIAGGLAQGPLPNGGFSWYFKCFPETFDPRKKPNPQ